MERPTPAALLDCIPGIQQAEFIQAGGQKAVYKVTIDGEAFALKMIAIDSEQKDDDFGPDVDVALQRAIREVHILEQVDVPVLARRGPLGLSTSRIDDALWLYFTEEWIAGRNLREIIRSGILGPKDVAKLGVDLIRAVCWLAERDLVHRDIKPANVMWAEDRSRFVLLDPGIALDLGGVSLTRLPMVVGTMAYLSPEQMEPLRKRTLDSRSDLFTIGVVLYEAASGEHPFMGVGSTPSQILAGILTEIPEPLAKRIHGFPTALSDVVGRLLGKTPHLRYRTSERARAAIEAAAADVGANA